MLDFLLLDPLFPRSVIHALMTVRGGLVEAGAAVAAQRSRSRRRRRAAARSGGCSPISEFLQLDRLFEGLPERLHRLERDMSEVSDMVARSYFETAPVVGWNLEESPP